MLVPILSVALFTTPALVAAQDSQPSSTPVSDELPTTDELLEEPDAPADVEKTLGTTSQPESLPTSAPAEVQPREHDPTADTAVQAHRKRDPPQERSQPPPVQESLILSTLGRWVATSLGCLVGGLAGALVGGGVPLAAGIACIGLSNGGMAMLGVAALVGLASLAGGLAGEYLGSLLGIALADPKFEDRSDLGLPVGVAAITAAVGMGLGIFGFFGWGQDSSRAAMLAGLAFIVLAPLPGLIVYNLVPEPEEA